MSKADDGWLLCGLAAGLVLRCVVELGPHSGEGAPPMFGDYEAQRHWMEITNALPLRQWYEHGPDNDLQYWGLDYPPLTAFHSWLLGYLGRYWEPACFALHSSRGFEGSSCKAFLRASVLASDLLIYLPGAALAARSFGHQRQRLTALWLLLPLVLIDHGHFQYNNVCLGLSLAAAGLVAQKRLALASVLFTSALLYKQIALYYAPAFFFGILGYCLSSPKPLRGVASAGLAVLSTAALTLWPWLQPQALQQVLHRMFPFARGLYEDKVANFWCSISVLFKVQRLVAPHRVPGLCALCTLLALLPGATGALRPGPGSLAAALFTSSLSFFLFAFQVHEKGVLFPATAVLLLPRSRRTWVMALHFQLVSLFSMYPLMVKDNLRGAYVFCSFCLTGLLLKLSEPSRRWPILCWCAFQLALHALQLLPPPSKYPDLWTLLITGSCCGYFLVALAVVSVAQMCHYFDEPKCQKDV